MVASLLDSEVWELTEHAVPFHTPRRDTREAQAVLPLKMGRKKYRVVMLEDLKSAGQTF